MTSNHVETDDNANSSSLKPLASLMFVIGLSLWLITPVLWLFIGAKIKVATDSLSIAVIVMLAGTAGTVAILVRWIVQLNETYRTRYHGIHDEEPKRTPIEPVLVVSAGVAMLAFGIWFLVFSKNPLGAANG